MLTETKLADNATTVRLLDPNVHLANFLYLQMSFHSFLLPTNANFQNSVRPLWPSVTIKQILRCYWLQVALR